MPVYYAMDDCVDRNLFALIYDRAYESELKDESKQKIAEKVKELESKQKQRLTTVLKEKLNLEKCSEDDIRVMQEYLETADLQSLQYKNAVRIMECFVSANSYYNGRRTKSGLEKLIGWDKLYKVKCKCGSQFVHHSGDFCEGGNYSKNCKKFQNAKWEKEFAEISKPTQQKIIREKNYTCCECYTECKDEHTEIDGKIYCEDCKPKTECDFCYKKDDDLYHDEDDDICESCYQKKMKERNSPQGVEKTLNKVKEIAYKKNKPEAKPITLDSF